MKIRRIGFILLAMVLVLTAAPLWAAESPMVIKYAHLGAPKPLESMIHAGAISFKYIVEKRSAGRMEVKIYPSGTLGKEVDLMEAVQNNAIQINCASLGGLFRIYPPAYLPFAPYVFRNAAIAQATIDGPFGRKLMDGLTQKTGIKGLRILDTAGYLVLTNNVRQLKSPADFKGIKFRGMDSLQVAMFKALGGSAVPIAWPEVYTSLQTGVVQGQTNPTFIVDWAKFYEVQKYLTLANTQYGYQMLICNKGWYDSLSAEDRRIIDDAAQMAQMTARGLGVVLEQIALEKLKERGMDIYALSDQETLEFQKVARPACLKWLKSQMDPKLVDDFMADVKAAEEKLGY
jgi:tripartite ATP-independent transporter DctP family solute receptor